MLPGRALNEQCVMASRRREESRPATSVTPKNHCASTAEVCTLAEAARRMYATARQLRAAREQAERRAPWGARQDQDEMIAARMVSGD